MGDQKWPLAMSDRVFFFGGGGRFFLALSAACMCL